MIALLVAGLVSLLGIAPSQAAPCECQCVGGRPSPICTEAGEPPPVCLPDACKAEKPASLPDAPLEPAPKTPGCIKHLVFNAKTKQLEFAPCK